MKISDKLFIEKNKQLFKNLVPGKLYSVFENEKPVEYKTPLAETIIKCERIGTKKTSYKMSLRGNRLLSKIAVCNKILEDGTVCMEHKAGCWIKNSWCDSCQKEVVRQRAHNNYFKTKGTKPAPLQRRAFSIWFKEEKPSIALSLAHKITGFYPRVADRHYIGMPRLDTFDEVEKGLCLK